MFLTYVLDVPDLCIHTNLSDLCINLIVSDLCIHTDLSDLCIHTDLSDLCGVFVKTFTKYKIGYLHTLSKGPSYV